MVEICCLILEYFLKCGYVIHHFNAHFLLYVFFGNEFILDQRNSDVRQKANLSDFFTRVQMGCKAAEITRNINDTFGPGTASECTVQWWVKEFCKGDKSLKDEEPGG